MEPEKPQGLFEKILFCTDFSSNADFAFSYALNLAKMNPNSTLYLLHVVPESDAQFWKNYIYEIENVDQKAKQDIEERLDRTYRAKVPAEIRFEPIFRIGRESQEILAVAQEKQVDLIVMGRHSQGSLQKMFFGNITEKVARQAPCAVLIVPLSYQEMLRKTPGRFSGE
ncbi:MAG: universal stress protein [Anaerohalosphaeraceae bacterium]